LKRSDGTFARALRTDLLSHLNAVGGGAELGLILPDLGRRVPGLPPAAPINAEAQRFRLFETVTAFLISISSSHPTLFVFDDLQWADQPSLLMLRLQPGLHAAVRRVWAG
jgi:predicted ATPase